MYLGVKSSVVTGLLIVFALTASDTFAVDSKNDRHEYVVDADWPQLPLPNNWVIGEVGGIWVDEQDHVWIVHRPSTLVSYELGAAATPPRSVCCVAAPPVIEFDPSGKIVRAWGGPGEGYDWPSTEHGITVDHKGNVWIGGSATRQRNDGAPADGMVLKFTRDGKFLLQIGHAGPSKGSLDTTQLSGAADIYVDPTENEAYIADGYGNHRVIVFDADSGKFKRMWGAYGKPPTDNAVSRDGPRDERPQQFRNVHCVEVARDGFVYVCDRDNNRMQIFEKDGTFVAEHFYLRDTQGAGTVGNISLWPDRDQSIIAIADIGNFLIRLVDRDNGDIITTFGHYGSYAGQMNRLHQAAFDSHGNLFTSEAAGKRVQKFVHRGARP